MESSRRRPRYHVIIDIILILLFIFDRYVEILARAKCMRVRRNSHVMQVIVVLYAGWAMHCLD